MNNTTSAALAVAKALASIEDTESNGAFACRTELPAEALALSIDGIENLPLPVSATRAKALAKLAKPAPFGKGRKTLLDPGVRDVGEIKKSRIKFGQTRMEPSFKAGA